MKLRPYTLDELTFAFSYQLYLRWHTHRSRPLQALTSLTEHDIAPLAGEYGIKVLECATGQTEILLLVGLRTSDSASACVSKIKGQISKHLRKAEGIDQPTNMLGTGYFACTSGKGTKHAIAGYLAAQAKHHGYANRAVPPVFEQAFSLSPEDETRLQSGHAQTILQFHLCLASSGRNGIFGSESGPSIAECWRGIEGEQKFKLTKVSFVPDHVHVAVRIHPSVAPANLVVELMNEAQALMSGEFREHMIQAGQNRLWEASAYVGSYGDISLMKIKGYMAKAL